MKIEGINVGIRKFHNNDIIPFHEAVAESFEHMKEFMSWCHPEYSLNESELWVASRKQAWDKQQDYSFAIYSIVNDELLGGIDINEINHQHKIGNVGYWVRKKALNQGVASEAIKLIVEFGFNSLDLNRLEIIMVTNNRASRKVAEKVGAQYDGVLEKRLIVHGTAMDACMYSLVKA